MLASSPLDLSTCLHEPCEKYLGGTRKIRDWSREQFWALTSQLFQSSFKWSGISCVCLIQKSRSGRKYETFVLLERPMTTVPLVPVELKNTRTKIPVCLQQHSSHKSVAPYYITMGWTLQASSYLRKDISPTPCLYTASACSVRKISCTMFSTRCPKELWVSQTRQWDRNNVLHDAA